MRPRSFSATALQTADNCLSRYQSENIIYGRGIQNDAAGVGTAVHGALEYFVTYHVKGKESAPDGGLKELVEFYKMSYTQTFGSVDYAGDLYEDGLALVKAWFKRTKWDGIEVLSCEVKDNYPIPVIIDGKKETIPFNYIWDRFDKIGEHEYRVVDYKTNRWSITPDDLGRKVQARIYALIAQIKYPDAERIWVTFDMLRHDKVGVVFTRQDNVNTWNFIKRTTQRIIDTPDEEAAKMETLNAECNFCVKKSSCEVLLKNIAAGGIFGAEKAEDVLDRRAALAYQLKAVENALKEMDSFIEMDIKIRDIETVETPSNKLVMKVSSRRAVDGERAERIVGPDIFTLYGKTGLTIAQLEKMMKDPALTEEQVAQLKGLIYTNYGEPKVSTVPQNPIDKEV
jgi:RecB family exonuclease